MLFVIGDLQESNAVTLTLAQTRTLYLRNAVAERALISVPRKVTHNVLNIRTLSVLIRATLNLSPERAGHCLDGPVCWRLIVRWLDSHLSTYWKDNRALSPNGADQE